MALVTCGACQAVNDIPIGHAFCSACGGKVHQAPPGALSPPSEEHSDADRGKVLSIVAISFAGAGVALFPAFGLVGLVLGIVALARGTQPGSTWKVLSIISVIAGALLVAVGIFLLMFIGILPAI